MLVPDIRAAAEPRRQDAHRRQEPRLMFTTRITGDTDVA
jgi:hypothetical protein